jgi:Methyltransferase domain
MRRGAGSPASRRRRWQITIGISTLSGSPVLREVRHGVGTALGRPRRWRYLEILPKGAIGAEIGVFRGEFTPHIIRVANPRRLHLIDGWWELYGERFPDWGAYTGHGTLPTRTAFEEARRRTRGKPVTFHVGDDLAILSTFEDRYLDWAYLDSSHEYGHTIEELQLLDRKVSGVIMGDDWREDPAADDPNAGGARAVRAFCESSAWSLLDPDMVFSQWAIARG